MYEQQETMESEVKELELNVAYGTTSHRTREENVYENLPCQDPVPLKAEKTINKPVSTATRYIAGFALLLASLALLVAVVTAAIYFSTPSGVELKSTLNQDNQHVVQNLQVELNSSKTEIAFLQDQFLSQNDFHTISNLHQRLQTLQAELNNSITAIRRLQTHIWNPVKTCSDRPPGSPLGDYWIQDDWTKSPVHVYCDMDGTRAATVILLEVG